MAPIRLIILNDLNVFDPPQSDGGAPYLEPLLCSKPSQRRFQLPLISPSCFSAAVRLVLLFHSCNKASHIFELGNF